MRTINLVVREMATFQTELSQVAWTAEETVVVQLYSGVIDWSYMKRVIDLIKQRIPHAHIVGTTTDGEVFQGQTLTEQLVVSIAIFSQTIARVECYSLTDKRSSQQLGRQLASDFRDEQLKCIFLYVAGFDINLQQLFPAFYEGCPHVPIVGGVAGDNGQFNRTFVCTEQENIEQGVVALALYSDVLQVTTFCDFDWNVMGGQLKITRMRGNRIDTINDQKATTVLKHYLGESFIHNIPTSAVQFPLAVKRDGDTIYSFLTNKFSDGSVEVSPLLYEGEVMTLAYPNIATNLQLIEQNVKQLAKRPIEAVFIFNCMSRRRYFSQFVDYEMELLRQLGDTVGFYAYGELYTPPQSVPKSYGSSLTVVALAETNVVKKKVIRKVAFEPPVLMETLMALTHLIQASDKDIVDLATNMEWSEQRYRSLFEHNVDIVYSVDMLGKITSANPALQAVLEMKEEQLLGHPLHAFFKEEGNVTMKSRLSRAFKGKVQDYEAVVKRQRIERIFHMTNIPIVIRGEQVGVYGIGRDITTQRETEQRVERLAYYDEQTGLANRVRFTEYVVEAIARSKRKKSLVAVLFIDIDRFKMINDSLGHIAGDELLAVIAERLRTVLEKGDSLGRFGGDKFTMLLTSCSTSFDVEERADTILREVTDSLFYHEQEFTVTASVGIALAPLHTNEVEHLLKNADTAMNVAKQGGGNQWRFFQHEMNEQALQRLELESYLRRAVEKRELYLCYQPYMELKSKRIVACEALVRWKHPKLGIVSPAEFIPLAEETGIILEIGRWVLEEACHQLKCWHERGFMLSMSVNVSANQFQHPHFVETVTTIIERVKIDPRYLHLELTESVMVNNVNYCIVVMEELQRLGIGVAIDDFGTGYSSLSYLKYLPLTQLKIDRSFIQKLLPHSPDMAIVNAIITMAQGLNMKVVAEGVETEEQMILLEQLHCHYAQGFFIERPLTIEQFEAQILTMMR